MRAETEKEHNLSKLQRNERGARNDSFLCTKQKRTQLSLSLSAIIIFFFVSDSEVFFVQTKIKDGNDLTHTVVLSFLLSLYFFVFVLANGVYNGLEFNLENATFEYVKLNIRELIRVRNWLQRPDFLFVYWCNQCN